MSWGFFAHKKINFLAVQITPTPLLTFYKSNVEFITEQAVAADKRRYIIEDEAARHYLDYDHYDTNKTFTVIPKDWKSAVEKYSEDTLKQHGILPWHLYKSLKNLEFAFKDKNWEKVLVLSADIGHYVGDAHVPLHTTHNYNGQFTNQYGIHGFWESRLPELFFNDYSFWVGKAQYIKNPLDKIWEIIQESHLAVDSVLLFEEKLNNQYGENKKYSIENKGRAVVRNYSEEYSARYHELLQGMVERRMKQAVFVTASFWYTAWINAGSPELPNIENIQLSQDVITALEKMNFSYENSKVIGRDCQH